MKTEHHELMVTILAAIESDTLVLPTLPDAAIKLQELIDNSNVSADEIVLALSSDPYISVQLIKSANSAAFADKRLVDNVRGAISRLGYRQVRNLVMAISMSKMFQSQNSVTHKQMKAVWERSREVAAVAYVLATHQPHLSPDQAMLAGLVHKVGVLPLCLHIEQNRMQITEDELQDLLIKYSATIGTTLLKKWNFPNDLIAVIGEYENLGRDSNNMPHADYTDIISISNLLGSTQADELWHEAAAVQRLGLAEEEWQTFVECHSERIASVAEMLGIAPPASRQAKTQTLSSLLRQKSGNPNTHTGVQDKVVKMKPSILARLFSFWKNRY